MPIIYYKNKQQKRLQRTSKISGYSLLTLVGEVGFEGMNPRLPAQLIGENSYQSPPGISQIRMLTPDSVQIYHLIKVIFLKLTHPPA
jgi:hypothetical protein